jgi:hypothetical protein
MITKMTSTFRSIVLLAVGGTIGLALVSTAALRAADLATLQPRSDQAAQLPLTAAFEKVTGGENGPYVLKLTNTSKEAVSVSAKILLSVAFHADNKARTLPEHTIGAGETWSIPDLAAKDKVILTAKDYAPMELVVP